jgi:hypothetical protein
LQHCGCECGVRVHGVWPRHGNPLTFILHPSILKPNLESVSEKHI